MICEITFQMKFIGEVDHEETILGRHWSDVPN